MDETINETEIRRAKRLNNVLKWLVLLAVIGTFTGTFLVWFLV
jgi:hypothetical protein